MQTYCFYWLLNPVSFSHILKFQEKIQPKPLTNMNYGKHTKVRLFKGLTEYVVLLIFYSFFSDTGS